MRHSVRAFLTFTLFFVLIFQNIFCGELEKVEKKHVKIKFKYFYRDFSADSFIKEHFPLDEYEYEVVEENPDVVFFSVFYKPKQPVKKFMHQIELAYKKRFEDAGRFLMPTVDDDALKVFITYENSRPDMTKCDYALAFDYPEDVQNDHYCRMPLFSARSTEEVEQLFNQKGLREGEEKTKFCNFIYSNDNSPVRKKFFQKLSEYKHIDSPGKSMNNMERLGPSFADKLAFQTDCKFSIAFENTSFPGYTTEKIVDAMVANTIPIYWGNPKIERDFNTKSFISYYDTEKEVRKSFPSFLFSIPGLNLLANWVVEELTLDRLVEKVIEVDTNDALYEEILSENWVNTETMKAAFDKEAKLNHIKQILNQAIKG